jgi:Mrp family chromosome partitioning ATPase/capsular polysaccharide biosynthesis protein
MPPEFRLPIEYLTEAVAFIRRRLLIILLTCSATLGIGLLYLIVAVPTFTADAELIVDLKAASGDALSVSTIVESQIAVIKSENIARAVIQRLDLAEDPEFARKDGVVRGASRSISRLLGWSRPEAESSALRYAMESFGRKLSAERAGVTYIIKITFDSTDPERAARILNTVAEAYVSAQLDAKYSSSLRDERWVKDRLEELSSRASAAQEALAAYQKSRKDIAGSADVTGAKIPPSQSTQRTQGELRELEASAESSARSYDNFLRVLRFMDAQQQSLPMLEAHVLYQASPPLRASSPKVGIVLGISIIGGMLLGIAVAMLRDMSDRGIRTGEQVSKELQIPCMAVVPRMKSYGAKCGALFAHGAHRHELALSPDSSSRTIAHTDSPIWAITDAKQSRFTEAFLEIKLAIGSMNRNGKRSQVIGITSTYPNEGKSTVAAALALLIAHNGASVILVDYNLQNQSLSAELAPGAALDVLDVMSGAASLRETTWIEPTTQLALLPLSNNRPIYPSEVLASGSLDKLLQTLRESYEYVIVDLPAVAPFAGAQAAACALDALIFVIEARRTSIDIVKHGLDVIRDENVVGFVLNKAKRGDV